MSAALDGWEGSSLFLLREFFSLHNNGEEDFSNCRAFKLHVPQIAMMGRWECFWFGTHRFTGLVTRHVEVKLRMSGSYAAQLQGNLRLNATDADYVFGQSVVQLGIRSIAHKSNAWKRGVEINESRIYGNEGFAASVQAVVPSQTTIPIIKYCSAAVEK